MYASIQSVVSRFRHRRACGLQVIAPQHAGSLYTVPGVKPIGWGRGCNRFEAINFMFVILALGDGVLTEESCR